MRAIVVIIALFTLLLSGVPMFTHPRTACSGITAHRTGTLIQPNDDSAMLLGGGVSRMVAV